MQGIAYHVTRGSPSLGDNLGEFNVVDKPSSLVANACSHHGQVLENIDMVWSALAAQVSLPSRSEASISDVGPCIRYIQQVHSSLAKKNSVLCRQST